MTQIEVETLIRSIIGRYVDTNDFFVFLFGSRAAQTSRPNSDYDIGIFGEKKIPFALIAKIKDELDNYPIPVNIDIIDFSTVSDDFKKLALKEIKIWNKPKKNLKLI